jgi:fructosamine-3-kinase
MPQPDHLPLRLAEAIGLMLGGHWRLQALGASGFCETWRAEPMGGMAGSARSVLFVKSLPRASCRREGIDVLAAEADGLQALARTRTIVVPEVAACGHDPQADRSVLAMTWLDLGARSGGGERFGRALAALHQAAPPFAGEGTPARFGWHRDNLLGATPQVNRSSAGTSVADWIGFFGRARLGALCERLRGPRDAVTSTVRGPQAERDDLCDAVEALIERLPRLFDDGHVPRPSLIHGDLWSGNWSALGDGTPVIFDPAVSVSDAEAELAMLELFGSPPAGFWPAYRAVTGGPAPGYERRREVYQLYHLLNHALLFGGGYLEQSRRLAQRLQRSLGAR